MSKVYTAARLKKIIDSYFDRCETDDVFPDCAGLRVFLSLTEEEIRALSKDDGIARLFSLAKDRRESILVRRMLSDSKMTSACMNALKQPENGGYNEKEPGGDKTLTVIMDGVGNGAFE